MSKTRDDLLMILHHAYGFALEVPFKGLSGKRRFRFDAADEEKKVAVDYHGWGSSAAHMYRMKQAGDHEKVSEASLCGWTYIICDAISVENGKCRDYIDTALDHWQARERPG